MIDGARAELDRERDRSELGELIAVQAQREARVHTCFEVPPSLVHSKCAALDEHVGSLRDRRRFGQHLRQGEVHVGGRVVELGRNSVRPQPGWNPAGGSNRAQRRKLRLAVEPIAGLGLERRRP